MSHMLYFYLCFAGVFSLILSAFMSASIWVNIAANFGLDACMRLLLASAMLRASFKISNSAEVNMKIAPLLKMSKMDIILLAVVEDLCKRHGMSRSEISVERLRNAIRRAGGVVVAYDKPLLVRTGGAAPLGRKEG